MIKYMTGLLATLATLAVVALVVMNRNDYTSMIEPQPALEIEEAPAVEQAPVVEQPLVEPADSLPQPGLE